MQLIVYEAICSRVLLQIRFISISNCHAEFRGIILVNRAVLMPSLKKYKYQQCQIFRFCMQRWKPSYFTHIHILTQRNSTHSHARCSYSMMLQFWQHPIN